MASFCSRRYTKDCFKIVNKCTRYIHKSSARHNSKWQLCSAVCLERCPIISSEKTLLENQFDDFMSQLEFENSLLSDHELRQIEDRKVADLRKKETYEETEDDSIRVTAAELEDKWTNDLTEFTPASRLTEADEKNDLRSLERKLDSKLILLVKQKLGNKVLWLLPVLMREDGETMRQTAERALHTLTGTDINAVFLGNAPCAYYTFNHPKSPTEDGRTKTKVFIFKAQWRKGQVEKGVSEDVSDFMWLTKDESKDFEVYKGLQQQLNKCVIDL